jgi:uncharacterized OB-fold protein
VVRHPEPEYLTHLAAGRFMLLRGQTSGKTMHYPRVAEPGTGNTDLEWVKASGDGVVYSVTVISVKPPGENYNVALIDLAEGPRMMSRVIGIAPEAVEIGMNVKARIIDDGGPIVVFEPVR